MSSKSPKDLQPVTGLELVAVLSVKDDDVPSGFSVFNVKANRRVYKEFIDQHERDRAYICELERLLKENNVPIPEVVHDIKKRLQRKVTEDRVDGIMKDGSLASLAKSVEKVTNLHHRYEINVQFRNLTFWSEVPKKSIPTVGSTFKHLIFGSGPKHRVDIIHDLTGRILPRTMTLVMGPPGCGKTTFLKALAGQLNTSSGHLDGDILYNGESVDCGKYLVGKVATYVDEKEQHAGTLTVRETLEFAWKMTTCGHHSYGVAKDAASAEIMNKDDAINLKLNNALKVLGLYEVSNTLVGDASIRGISGGQKRRVTLGEMLMPPRPIKFLDSISNGLDAATTYDIVQALRFLTHNFGSTTVISLLQPSPDVFYSFEDVIVMAEGQIVYHGPTTKVLQYFKDLGYHCPEIMDVADFLQELPTVDGKRFTVGHTTAAGGAPPIGTEELVKAWKESSLFLAMVEYMDVQVSESTGQWPESYNERYPGSFWFSFTHCWEREQKLLRRNTTFLKGRAIQSVLIGAIAGSLFSDLPVEDTNSMSGVLFFAALTGAFSAMSMLPIIFAQRAVFYKHSRNLFYPTAAFVMAQTIVMYPLMIAETLVFNSIVYWSVGLSDDYNGSRYFTFMFVVFVFSLCMSQFFRLLASTVATATIAQPLAGVAIVLMILFSGFIIPKSNIPPGWEWFYWINPVAYVLRSVTVNEYLAPDYDFPLCSSPTDCQRFGDVALESRGNPTEQVWVWYGVAVLVALYLFMLTLTTLALVFIRQEAVPPAPIEVDFSEEEVQAEKTIVEIPFDPVSFAFKDIWYTVKLSNHEELDLLKGVSGYFEPGTLTALMGSSGAGKTTLLDVLSGRKNTGEVSGSMCINGKPKDDKLFKRIMGYVEQFDSLAPHDTAREAVEFSAALRLPGDTPANIRTSWVTSVLTLLELMPLEHTMVGSEEAGGMSFEQKKRVSIAVELAANPAILFLDEPTSGLDSRSAQVVIRCIKRVAASGRSIVCTIHQPSAVIFEAFDSLLLLRRGGQTVYFGELGDNSSHLINYFEAIPGVTPKPPGTNPATWMLEVIGAGTGSTSSVVTDYHAVYKNSSLCVANTTHVDVLCPDPEEEGHVDDPDPSEADCRFKPVFIVKEHIKKRRQLRAAAHKEFNASYWVQFRVLMYRFQLAYWRSPSYNFVRMVVSIVVALLFSSTYADQQYSSDVDVVSRVALIYITVLFMGVVGMMSAQPVLFAERPAFYREQYSDIYDVKLYALAATLVEVPYLVLSSVFFIIPYFWIVGFDNGDVAAKFFWYWLFQGMYMATLVFIGHALAAALPNAATAQVVGGMTSTFISLFCGFTITASNFPSFWIFMYWLDPLHYALEGLVTTQFYGDNTPITVTGFPGTVTASSFVESFYSDWQYSHRGLDIMALCLFIVALRMGTYLSLEYLRHDKR